MDVVTGLSSDTGEFPGYTHTFPLEMNFRANLTVTLHAKKVGHCKSYGIATSGKVVVTDIGLGKWRLAGNSIT